MTLQKSDSTCSMKNNDISFRQVALENSRTDVFISVESSTVGVTHPHSEACQLSCERLQYNPICDHDSGNLLILRHGLIEESRVAVWHARPIRILLGSYTYVVPIAITPAVHQSWVDALNVQLSGSN